MNLPTIAAAYREHAARTFLKDQDADAFWQACLTPLRLSIRVNTLRTSVDRFCQRADAYGWRLTPIPWCPCGFWVDQSEAKVSFSLSHSPEHLLGEFYIQEASSMMPPEVLGIDPFETDCWVMDMAAAPGSKTTQLAASMQNRGLLLANELSASRLKSLHGNLLRMGVTNCYLSHWDAARLGGYLEKCFDYILLDAPCGGEGTVRKDLQALSQWQHGSVLAMAELQKTLIMSAYQALRPGGRLVYSTCTLSYEENQQVVAHLLDNSDAQVVSLAESFSGCEKALTSEGYLHILPHLFDSEGFFVAALTRPQASGQEKEQVHTSRQAMLMQALKRQDSASKQKQKRPLQNKKQSHKQTATKKRQHVADAAPQPLTAGERALLTEVGAHFQFSFEQLDGQFYRKENTLWFVSAQADKIKHLIKLNRLGLMVGEIKGKKLRLSHECAVLFGARFGRQKLDINRDQLRHWLTGANLELSNEDVQAGQPLSPGEILICYQQQPVGLGLLKNEQVKNNMARHLIMDKVQF